MKLTEVKDDQDLWLCMTTPSQGLVKSLYRTGSAPIMILGGSGKMGKELTGLVQAADKLNGYQRDIMVASTFSNMEDLHWLESNGVACYRGDLSDEAFLASLPDASLVVYMMGFKFGSSDDWRKSFHMNAVVPYLVGKKYQHSSIVVFSSGNPYPHTSRYGTGAKENDELTPEGIYGWSIVARESAFKTTALQYDKQHISIYRLMYAQHLNYGVLVDLARIIIEEQPISLQMPAVNLISQRDANEVALRSFEKVNTPGWVVNAAGPVCQVRAVAELLAKRMGKRVNFTADEQESALLADDTLARDEFGAYQDSVQEMIEAVASWVLDGGAYWNKPTLFGRVKHSY